MKTANNTFFSFFNLLSKELSFFLSRKILCFNFIVISSHVLIFLNLIIPWCFHLFITFPYFMQIMVVCEFKYIFSGNIFQAAMYYFAFLYILLCNIKVKIYMMD